MENWSLFSASYWTGGKCYIHLIGSFSTSIATMYISPTAATLARLLLIYMQTKISIHVPVSNEGLRFGLVLYTLKFLFIAPSGETF